MTRWLCRPCVDRLGVPEVKTVGNLGVTSCTVCGARLADGAALAVSAQHLSAAQQATAGEARDRAAAAIVDLVSRLIVAATDGRAHLSHEGGRDCLGCLTVKQAKLFVRGMRDDTAANDNAEEPIDVRPVV